MTPTEAIINIRVAAAFFAGFGITRKDEEQREEFRSLNAMILDAVAALETQLIPGSVVLPEDLDEIRIRLQNIHGTGLAVMREDAEAIAQRLGLSWDVEPEPSLADLGAEPAPSRAPSDPDAFHRLLDEVAPTIGRERTEALRATLPRR